MREFNGFGQFAAHLLKLAVEGPEVTHHLAVKSADLIARDAKHQIGEYQPKVGPYGAWPELAESTERDKASKGYPSDAPLLRGVTCASRSQSPSKATMLWSDRRATSLCIRSRGRTKFRRAPSWPPPRSRAGSRSCSCPARRSRPGCAASDGAVSISRSLAGDR